MGGVNLKEIPFLSILNGQLWVFLRFLGQYSVIFEMKARACSPKKAEMGQQKPGNVRSNGNMEDVTQIFSIRFVDGLEFCGQQCEEIVPEAPAECFITYLLQSEIASKL